MITRDSINKQLKFVNDVQSVLFTVSCPKAHKYLFVSDAASGLLGQASSQLMKNPALFFDAVVREDKGDVQSALLHQRAQHQGPHSIFYKVEIEKTMHYIKDTGHVLVDNKGHACLTVSVAENLSLCQWQHAMALDLRGKAQKIPFFLKDILSMLCRTYNLSLQLAAANDSVNSTRKQPIQLYIGDSPVTLTPREKQCLDHLLDGLSAKQTAYHMHLSVRTVETYLESLRRKTSCRSKVELMGRMRDYAMAS